MEREKIRESLDAVARERGAGERDLWPGVEGRVRDGGRQKSPARSEWMPMSGRTGSHGGRFNFGLAGVITLLFVGIGGVALVLGVLSSGRGLSMTPALNIVVATATKAPTVNVPPDENVKWGFEGHDNIYKLSSYVGITKTRGGYTVTLERVYADVNRVAVFYSAQRANGVRLTDLEMELTLPDGSTTTSHSFGATTVGRTTWASGAMEVARDTNLVVFDVAALSPLPNRASLALRLNVMAVDKYEAAHPTVVAASQSFEETQARWRALSTEFDFNFEVPVTKAGTRVLELNQSVEVNGETLTLERVEITPIEFRARYKYTISAEDAEKYIWRANSWLQMGDPAFDTRQQVPPMGYTYTNASEGQDFSIIWPFDDMSGEWTLSVYEIRLRPKVPRIGDRGQWDKTIRGPWEFKFTVPPVDK